MKKYPLLFVVLFFFSFKVFSQELQGRKIINADLNVTISNFDGYNVSSVNSSFLYGKIRQNNTYLSYGFRLGFFHNIQNQPNRFSIGPAVETGKFVKLIDKLYLSPYFGGSTQGIIESNDFTGVNINAYFVPVRFLYDFSPNFMLSASFGSAGLNLLLNQGYSVFTLNGSLTNNSGIGVFYTFK